MMKIDGLLRASAARTPDAVALVDYDGTEWRFAELLRAAEEIGRSLVTAGVQPNDRVLVVTENCAALCAYIFGCSIAGAWAVPVNARMTAPELDRIIGHAKPRLGVFFNEVSSDAADHATRWNAVGAPAIAEFGPSEPASEHGVAVLLYTTGTTGTPKGVMLTHDNLVFAGKTSVNTRGLVPTDILYGALPLTHVFGMASMLMAAMHIGATVRLESRFAPDKLYQALIDGVTVLPAVPQMHALLMQYTFEKGIQSIAGGSLRYVSSGAAPLDPVWKRKAEEFYGIALQNGYGMTESTAGVCTTHNAMGDPDISVGPALPGVEIAIDEHAPGGGDGVGEVLTRGPHIMLGYYENIEATAAALDKGWMRTGDLGRIDEQNRLHILGRSKELIIRGGFNVYPPEVEAAFNDHPKVVQSAVIGRPTDTGDEEVLAFVQTSTPEAVSDAELRAFVETRLTAYKRPAHIIIAQSLPAAPTGKLLKNKLLDAFADQLKTLDAAQS